MNGETRPAGAGFDHLQEEVSPSGCALVRVSSGTGDLGRVWLQVSPDSMSTQPLIRIMS